MALLSVEDWSAILEYVVHGAVRAYFRDVAIVDALLGVEEVAVEDLGDNVLAVICLLSKIVLLRLLADPLDPPEPVLASRP